MKRLLLVVLVFGFASCEMRPMKQNYVISEKTAVRESDKLQSARDGDAKTLIPRG